MPLSINSKEVRRNGLPISWEVNLGRPSILAACLCCPLRLSFKQYILLLLGLTLAQVPLLGLTVQ